MELERKGTAKVRTLLDIEKQMQETWDAERLFEVDAPATPSASTTKKVLWAKMSKNTACGTGPLAHWLAHTAHSFARSRTSLTPSLVGQ